MTTGNTAYMQREAIKRLATITETGEILALSRPMIYRLRRDGLLDFVMIGTAPRVTMESIDRVAREGCGLLSPDVPANTR